MDFRSFEAPAGERLDVAIGIALEQSRSYAKELVTEGYVQINGEPILKASAKLKGGEIVTVILPPVKPMMVEAEDIPIDIIYQDDDLVAINKPPNLTAHPTPTVRTGTVVNALMGKMELSKEKHFDPSKGDYRPGIVHRLDKDTTGVMVIAKHDEAHRALSNAFKKRLTHKEYIAIGAGHMADEVHVDAPIGRDPRQRHQMTIGGLNSKSASTLCYVIARTPKYVLVKAQPHTGRTHQIRVHMRHLGAGLIGDQLYGSLTPAIERQALHAHQLTLPHPRDNQGITFRAQVPEDMIQAWLRLGGQWPADL